MIRQYKSRKVFISLFALLLLLFTAYSSVMAKADDSIDNISIDTFIQHEMKAGNIPGLAIGIVRGDKVIYLKGFGTAGPEKGRVTPDTSFILGSVSKSFTGLAVLQLVEKGAICLDDPVKKYIPWFSIIGPKQYDTVKIIHLLNHTSGIPAFEGHDSGIERGNSIEERIRLKNGIRINHIPGTTFEYSCLNYDILGEVIQVVSGQSYQEYIEKNIFHHLEMNHSYTSLKEASRKNLAVGYRPWFGFQIPAEINYSMSALPSSYIISSAEDMTHYLIAFINQGKYKQNVILSDRGIEKAQASIGNTSYGAGWFSGGYYKWHTGELANYNAYICVVPSQKLGIIMLSNTNDIGVKFLNRNCSSLWRIPEGIRVLLMGGLLPEDPVLNSNMTYLVINLVIILLLWLVVMLLIRSIRHRFEKRTTCYQLGIRAMITLIIPGVLFFGIPAWIHGSWPALLISVPDLTLSLLVLSTLTLISCVITIISVVYRLKEKIGKPKT